MKLTKSKIQPFLFPLLFLLFCFIYRFLIEGISESTSFYQITDYTINTSGYLNYFHTATFYTIIYLFLLGKKIYKLSNQTLVRISRKNLYYKNNIIAIKSSFVYALLLLVPHLIFMYKHFDFSTLIELNFNNIMSIQFISYFLYFFLIGNIMLLIYYLTINNTLSQLLTITISILLMFAYKLLNIYSPIEFVLVCTKYYSYGLTVENLIISLLFFIPIIFVFLLSQIQILKERDVL